MQIQAYFRQSEAQIWLLGILGLGIIIVLSVGYLLYDTFGSIVFTEGQSLESVAQHSQPEVATINQISRTPLFGASHQPKVSRVNTNLELLGVMLDSNPKKSRAIIASSGNEPKIYHIDEKLVDGGKLYRVYENKVELQENGQIESLYLKWDKKGTATRKYKPAITVPETITAPNISEQQPAAEQEIKTDLENIKPSQTPQEWQERIKEIREKYQKQFGVPNAENPRGVPKFPRGPMERFRGNM